MLSDSLADCRAELLKETNGGSVDYAYLPSKAAETVALALEIASCLCGLPPSDGTQSEVAQAWMPKVKALQVALESLNIIDLQATWREYLATCKKLRGEG